MSEKEKSKVEQKMIYNIKKGTLNVIIRINPNMVFEIFKEKKEDKRNNEKKSILYYH